MDRPRARALLHYRESITLLEKLSTMSQSPEALNALAWVLVADPFQELRDGAAGLGAAQKANSLTATKSTDYLDSLAAVHARSGDNAHAVELQTKVFEDPAFAEDEGAKQRLSNYKAGKPWPDKRVLNTGHDENFDRVRLVK